jgi:hypothetical protein
VGYIHTNNRQYNNRNNILINHKFNPDIHLEYNKDGVSNEMSNDFINDIYKYFSERNEDETIKKTEEKFEQNKNTELNYTPLNYTPLNYTPLNYTPLNYI